MRKTLPPRSRDSRGLLYTRTSAQKEVQSVDTSTTIRQGDGLVLVDVQNDFLPGGALGVPQGDEVIEVLNRYIAVFRGHGLPIIATRDWHPADHCSFRERGGPWPAHCVQGSQGAAFAPGLDLPEGVPVVSKADSPDQEDYSCFSHTDLHLRLRSLGVKRLFCGGLATDYCVLETVTDALGLGYEVVLLEDAIRAVNVNPGDGAAAVQKMRRMGAHPIQCGQLAA